MTALAKTIAEAVIPLPAQFLTLSPVTSTAENSLHAPDAP